LCAGTYVFHVTDAAGCTQNSDTVVIPGVNSLGEPNAEVYVYPNPTEGKVWVRGGLEGQEFILFDAQGRECLRGEFEFKNELELKGLATGWYMLRVGEMVYKILKE
jgi:hypothetical protein